MEERFDVKPQYRSAERDYPYFDAKAGSVMLSCARRVVVVADSSKIGKVAFARICEITEISELITDAAADADAVRALTDSGVHVTLVGGNGRPAAEARGG